MSRSALSEEPSTDSRDPALSDQVFLLSADALVEVPAVEICTSYWRADVKVRLERSHDTGQRMEVRAMLANELIGCGVFVCTERTSLFQPPRCSAQVKSGDVELVDEQRSLGLEDFGQPFERRVERLDVVERQDRKRGIEGRRGLIELVQPAGSDVGATRIRVNRDHLVARLGKGAGQLAITGADLQ